MHRSSSTKSTPAGASPSCSRQAVAAGGERSAAPRAAECGVSLDRRARRCRARGEALWCLGLVVAAACSDGTGPGGGTPPGRQLLATPEFSAWVWHPSGQEIVFSSRFDYPYTGPPVRLEAVSVSSGARRTIVAPPTSGDEIVPARFSVQGTHVYFLTSRPGTGTLALHRAPLSGGTPELVVDVLQSEASLVSVAPNERAVAWVRVATSAPTWRVVVADVASGVRREYPLEQHAERVVWSPSGRSVVTVPNGIVTAGTPFQRVDLESGAVRVWLAPSNELSLEGVREFGWEGEAPILYNVTSGSPVRYNLATDVREQLGPGSAAGYALGWGPGFETVVVSMSQCLERSSGPLGGDCSRWTTDVARIAWRTGDVARVLRHEGDAPIGGRLSPTGASLAYEYHGCGGGCYTSGDALYVVPVP